jgi:preprotein translocase subunit SecG
MLTTVVLIAVVVVGAATVTAILMQQGNVAGLMGGATGMGQQMFGKKKGLDELLERVTMILGGVLIVLIVVADKLWH